MQEVIGVFGLGFVGSSIAAVWLRSGANVIGYDISSERLESIKKGSKASEADPDVEGALREGVRSGKLDLSTDGVAVSRRSDVKFVCVPVYLQNNNNSADLSALESACSTIAKGLKRKDAVVICPSVPPGTTRKVVAGVLERESQDNLKAGLDFDLIYSPERILVGRAVKDIEENYPAVVSAINDPSLNRGEQIYRRVARRGVIRIPSLEAAELEKLAEGVYRDVNIALANELALVCDELGVDYFTLREAANSQPYCNLHLPGFGVGGACIPVYPIFVRHSARNTKTGLIGDYRRINDSMSLWLARSLKGNFGANEKTKIAILGLAFRGGIADSRLSVTYRIVDNLAREGMTNVRVHDPLISNDSVLGNRLTGDLKGTLEWADIAVIATDHQQYKNFEWGSLSRSTQLKVIDGRGILRGDKASANIQVFGLGYGKYRVGLAEE